MNKSTMDDIEALLMLILYGIVAIVLILLMQYLT